VHHRSHQTRTVPPLAARALLLDQSPHQSTSLSHTRSATPVDHARTNALAPDDCSNASAAHRLWKRVRLSRRASLLQGDLLDALARDNRSKPCAARAPKSSQFYQKPLVLLEVEHVLVDALAFEDPDLDLVARVDVALACTRASAIVDFETRSRSKGRTRGGEHVLGEIGRHA
jgi:hypothetical protein